MADDDKLVSAVAAGFVAVERATVRTGERVESVEAGLREVRDEVRALGASVQEAGAAADRAAAQSTLVRAELRQLTDATQALIERRERTPVTVAAAPRRFRWPLVLVGATAALLAVAGLAAGLYIACSGALPPGHSWADGIERRRPVPRPRPRADMALGKSPTDTTVDPDELEKDSDRAGCAPYAGTLQELRPPGCRDNLR